MKTPHFPDKLHRPHESKARNLNRRGKKTRTAVTGAEVDFCANFVMTGNVKQASLQAGYSAWWVKPARKSVVSLLAKVKQVVREHLGRAAHLLISRLNPIIRGWTNYHRHVVSKRVFARVDAAIFRMLWHWAQARHPRKGSGWIKQKYFDRVKMRDWWFFGDTTDAQDSPLRLRLFHAASVRIIRHVKVRSGLNPYDPSWAPYLSRRRAFAPHRARS